MKVKASSSCRGTLVGEGRVETVYSTVVGDGRRVRRWGFAVNMAARYSASSSSLRAR